MEWNWCGGFCSFWFWIVRYSYTLFNMINIIVYYLFLDHILSNIKQSIQARPRHPRPSRSRREPTSLHPTTGEDVWWTCDARERDGVRRHAYGGDEHQQQGDDDDATRGDPARGGGLPRRFRRRKGGRRRPHASCRPRGSREGSGAQIRRHGQTERAQGECDDDDDLDLDLDLE